MTGSKRFQIYKKKYKLIATEVTEGSERNEILFAWHFSVTSVPSVAKGLLSPCPLFTHRFVQLLERLLQFFL
jgi:hypothetical protein